MIAVMIKMTLSSILEKSEIVSDLIETIRELMMPLIENNINPKPASIYS